MVEGRGTSRGKTGPAVAGELANMGKFSKMVSGRGKAVGDWMVRVFTSPLTWGSAEKMGRITEMVVERVEVIVIVLTAILELMISSGATARGIRQLYNCPYSRS